MRGRGRYAGLQEHKRSLDEAVDAVKGLAFLDAVKSPAESYRDGTHEIHIHFVWKAQDHCAVFRRPAERRDKYPLLNRPVGPWLQEPAAVDARSGNQEMAVFVGVVQALEDDKNVILWVPPLLLGHCVGLNPLDKCPRFFGHSLGPMGEIAAIGGIGFDVTTGTLDATPRVRDEDRKVDEFVLHLGRVQRDGHVVEGSTTVEQEVANRDCPRRIGFSLRLNSVHPPWLLLGFHACDNRMFAAGGVLSDGAFVLIQVLLCPVELQPPRSVWVKTAHDLALEDHAEDEPGRPDARDAAQEGQAGRDTGSDQGRVFRDLRKVANHDALAVRRRVLTPIPLSASRLREGSRGPEAHPYLQVSHMAMRVPTRQTRANALWALIC